MNQDIRWEQRFSNYVKALRKLTEAVDFINNHEEEAYKTEKAAPVLNEIIKEGLIQRFEYTHELAWNVMKDYAKYQENSSVGGFRDATREAFQLKLINDGEVWMDMIRSRNQTSHTYDDETADEIHKKILSEYHPAFLAFGEVMRKKLNDAQFDLFQE
ncbi:hypothetical protein Barb4_00568 [Bacteroidales bacterium Barb4]|nr:hypothetical protein Barb4_00568 [Bacteroidales bacterium Barb4]